jgi:hypothetical protein
MFFCFCDANCLHGVSGTRMTFSPGRLRTLAAEKARKRGDFVAVHADVALMHRLD